MQYTFYPTKKICGNLLCMIVGLAPFQASLAVTSSSVSAATSSAKAKPAPEKPTAVIVTKTASAKPAAVIVTKTASAKPIAHGTPVAAPSIKSAGTVNANGASQKSTPATNAVPSAAVSQIKTAEP